MSCGKCGRANVAGLCRDCARDRYRDPPADDADADWDVAQQGLGDRDPEGQTTLTGDIVRGGDADA